MQGVLGERRVAAAAAPRLSIETGGQPASPRPTGEVDPALCIHNQPYPSIVGGSNNENTRHSEPKPSTSYHGDKGGRADQGVEAAARTGATATQQDAEGSRAVGRRSWPCVWWMGTWAGQFGAQ